MYKLTLGHRYAVETRDGEKINGPYAGWLRTDDGIVHRFGVGRARRELADRAIASVTG